MEETVIRMAAPTLAGIKTGSLFPYYYQSREELGKEMGRLNRLLIPRGLRLVLLRLTERSALLAQALLHDASVKRNGLLFAGAPRAIIRRG